MPPPKQPKFTLDTNCIFAVDDDRPERVAIDTLLRAHAAGEAAVALVAISASELQRGGVALEDFVQFQQRVEQLGFGGLELLMPMFYWDVGFWDHAYWDPETDISEKAIHEILFPNMPFEYDDYCRQLGLPQGDEPSATKWKNAKCDVQAYWSHAHHRRDVFVTSDKNFLAATKRQHLVALSGGRIETPDSAVQLLRSHEA